MFNVQVVRALSRSKDRVTMRIEYWALRIEHSLSNAQQSMIDVQCSGCSGPEQVEGSGADEN
jgi:hypothetical protein